MGACVQDGEGQQKIRYQMGPKVRQGEESVSYGVLIMQNTNKYRQDSRSRSILLRAPTWQYLL